MLRLIRSLVERARRERQQGGHRQDGEDRVRTDGGTVDPAVGSRSRGERAAATVRTATEGEFLRSAVFWLPPLLLTGLFVYGAIGWNVVISLTDWNGLGDPEYASFDVEMYARMLSDATFLAAARNTVALLVAFTVVTLLLGLFLAILVDRGIRFEGVFRTVYLLPMSLSFVVTAIFWAWIYNFENGLLNELFRAVGANFLVQGWISDPQFKLAAVVFALVWQFSGYAMVVYLAGLQSIPTDQFEAARVDGAGTVKLYLRVIVPQLRASTTSAAVVLMVFALKAFDFLFVLFGTNLGKSVDILAVMMYREAFGSGNWAYGSAIATVLFLMALSVIGPYLYYQYRRGDL